jgi:large subunit ribosomal protein L35Ae
MEAQIVSYRRGKRNQYDNHLILKTEEVSSREDAEKLVGKKVSWTAPGKNKTTIEGEIMTAHGNSGAVRAIFERGLPGQAIMQKVSIK